MEQLQAQLIQSLEVILVALLGLATSYAVYYLKKSGEMLKTKTAVLKDEHQVALVNNAIDRVQILAENTVMATEQSAAKALRELVKDGKVDKAELEVLGKKAVDEVYSQLSEQTKEALSGQIVDLEAYIQSVVERVLYEIKK